MRGSRQSGIPVDWTHVQHGFRALCSTRRRPTVCTPTCSAARSQ